MEVQAIVVDESETRVPTCVVFTDRLVTYVFIAFVLYYGLITLDLLIQHENDNHQLVLHNLRPPNYRYS